MVGFKSLLEWLSRPEGLTVKDKVSIFYAKLAFLSLRLFLRLFLGKRRRNDYFVRKNLTFGSFMPCGARVKYYGFLVHLRPGAEDLGFLSPYHEPEIVKLLQEQLKRDDNFVNIGANVGKYVLLASKYIDKGRIIAVEPHPETFKVLVENVSLNELNVECINVAVSDREGFDKLYISANGSGRNSLLSQGRTEKYIQVKITTLDSLVKALVLNKIDWLLIDVEGAEDKVLTAAPIALSITDKIIVEAHSDENYKFVTNMLKENGFEITTIYEAYSMPHILGRRFR
ncbi:MAG: FkbM family methyltransferase [Nitrososphaerales archaeon]